MSCLKCDKKRKLAELSGNEKTKLKMIEKLANENKLQDALAIAETLSLEARNHIPDYILFKFSNMEEKLNEMSGTGGSAAMTPGTGMGMATKPAFRKKVRKPKYFQNVKNRNKKFGTKLSSLLYEVLDELQSQDKNDIFLKIKMKADKMLAAKPGKFSDEIYYTLCKMYNVDPDEFFAWRNFEIGSVAGGEINESISYNKFKSQAKTKNNQAAFHSAVKEIKKRIQEVNKILEYTNKMRTELSEDKALKYSRFTEKALGQLTTMIAELYGNLKQLKK